MNKNSLNGNLFRYQERLMYFSDQPMPPAYALECLADQSCGFGFVELNLTPEDFADLDAIIIDRAVDFNEFGNIDGLREKIESYLMQIGSNHPDLIERVAKKIDSIAREIFSLSGRNGAWICLRSSTPNHRFDIPRWHMDGHYFAPGKELQYKFAISLIGPSTLFYPFLSEHAELRKIIGIHMSNRLFMNQLCDPSKKIAAERGVGALFLAGDQKQAAIHSEPPITENRLFFSIVPCDLDKIGALKEKVLRADRLKIK